MNALELMNLELRVRREQAGQSTNFVPTGVIIPIDEQEPICPLCQTCQTKNNCICLKGGPMKDGSILGGRTYCWTYKPISAIRTPQEHMEKYQRANTAASSSNTTDLKCHNPVPKAPSSP